MSKQLDIPIIIEVIKKMLAKNDKKVVLHEPHFVGNEWKYTKECLDTGWVSSIGKYVDEFEKSLAAFMGVKHAIAVASGTAALHICLKLSGVQQGDEVLVPALTFIATANAVVYCGGIPHFIDSDFKSLGVHPEKLERYLKKIAVIKGGQCYNKITQRPIKAVIAVHTFGHPVEMEPLISICKKYNLELIEDAAQALGSSYKTNHIGCWGKLSALSFNGNKIITTGGGGAIVTNDSFMAKKAKHLTTTAKIPHQWLFEHDQIGYNYRLPNINAALGCAQLENIHVLVENKRRLAQKYQLAFKDIAGVGVFQEMPYAKSNYWLNILLLDESNIGYRDSLIKATHQEGIITRPAWTLMSKLLMFTDCPKMDLSNAENLERRIINLPSSPGIGVDKDET